MNKIFGFLSFGLLVFSLDGVSSDIVADILNDLDVKKAICSQLNNLENIGNEGKIAKQEIDWNKIMPKKIIYYYFQKEARKMQHEKKANLEEESSNRIKEIMIYDRNRLEFFQNGFGDAEFRSSVINSVMDDILILRNEFADKCLATVVTVKEVMSLLKELIKIDPSLNTEKLKQIDDLMKLVNGEIK